MKPMETIGNGLSLLPIPKIPKAYYQWAFFWLYYIDMNYYNHLTADYHININVSAVRPVHDWLYGLSLTKGTIRFSRFANVNYANFPEAVELFTREAERKGVNDLVGVYSPTEARYWFTTNADFYRFQTIANNSILNGMLYEEFYDIEENDYRREEYDHYFNCGYTDNEDQYLNAIAPLDSEFGYYTYEVSNTQYSYFDVTNIQNMKTYKTDLFEFYEYTLNMVYSTSNYTQLGDKIYDFHIECGSYHSSLIDTAYQNGYNAGVGEGYTQGFNAGYNQGAEDTEATTGESVTVFNYIGQAFDSVSDILSLEVLPHVTLGLCFSIPLVFILIMTLFKLVKK